MPKLGGQGQARARATRGPQAMRGPQAKRGPEATRGAGATRGPGATRARCDAGQVRRGPRIGPDSRYPGQVGAGLSRLIFSRQGGAPGGVSATWASPAAIRLTRRRILGPLRWAMFVEGRRLEGGGSELAKIA